MVDNNIEYEHIEQPILFESSSEGDGLFIAEQSSMPEGHYSGDQPNPHLRAFVERHLEEHPYLPDTDDYKVTAFTTPIDTTKATAIYNMHTYWSKKPHDAIRQYICHYTQLGDLVLDPFCGSGGTALAALMEGRKAIAIDRSPAATFITKNYCTPVNTQILKRAFLELQRKVQPEIEWLYETRCDRCDGPATTVSTVYSQVFQCPRCLKKVPLFDCIKVDVQTPAGKTKKIDACPACYELGIEEEISTRAKKFGAVPVLVNYLCKGKCKSKRGVRSHKDENEKKREYFEKYDLGKIKEIESKEIPYWYPPHKMMNVEDDLIPWGVEWREGRNFRRISELFTKRNLWALAAILDACKSSSLADTLLYAFSGNLLSGTKMQRYREGGGGFANGTYYLPQLSMEREQLSCLARKIEDIISAQYELQRDLQTTQLAISTQSGVDLSAIPNNAVDYIFTDPPYADKVQYGELNFIWEAWLGFDTNWHEEEIIVNSVRGKSEAEWAAMMKRALAECYRVLKPGRWLTLCYHDTSEGTWTKLQDMLAEVGFVPDTANSVLFIDAAQKSYNQLTADKITKRDLVINFRKPWPGEASSVTITGDEDEATFREKVHTIMRDYLLMHPGTAKDRIYDEVVSRMVRIRQMEEHDFDELLEQIAEPHGDDHTSWFLLPGDEVQIDEAESAREDAAAAIISTFISNELNGQDEQEGVHYSNIFEHFLYKVREKPRRQLADWLPDYFYITEVGSYRLPASEEEWAAKAQTRQSGTSRRIKRFLAYLEQGLQIPDSERPSPAIMADWIHQCCITHQYQQGRLLYERGGLDLDRLSDDQLVAVEEDYQLCVIQSDRNALQQQKQAQEQKKKKRPRRTAQTGPTLFDEINEIETPEESLSNETA